MSGESSTQIAPDYGVERHAITKWLRRLNVPIRDHRESLHLRFGNHCDLSSEAMEFIDGELLGDMSIRSNRRYSASIKYTSKHWEYICWISQQVCDFGIEQSGRIGIDMLRGREYYHYESRKYAELLDVRHRWYPSGKKVVPLNVKLTPTVLRQWYIGDGSMLHDNRVGRNGRSHVGLYSMGFSKEDVARLVEMLCELGFRAKVQPSNNNIRISTYSTPDFLDYIGDCPVGCYRYKWDVMGRVSGSDEFSGQKPGGKNV